MDAMSVGMLVVVLGLLAAMFFMGREFDKRIDASLVIYQANAAVLTEIHRLRRQDPGGIHVGDEVELAGGEMWTVFGVDADHLAVVSRSGFHQVITNHGLVKASAA